MPTSTPDAAVWFEFATSLSFQLGKISLLDNPPHPVISAITLLITALQSLNRAEVCDKLEDAQVTVLEWCLESDDPACHDLQDTLEEIEDMICSFGG